MSSSPATAPTTTGRAPNRWLILAGGILVQLALGAVYAWSVFGSAFQAPASVLHLTKVESTVPFEVAIGMIFLGTFLGGRIQDRKGPRTVALAGVVLYALGIIISSFARGADQLWLLILGYGVIGGFGLGLAYIVPIAMLQKWFPDKAALVTGLAVGGFGFGAVITAPVAQMLLRGNPTEPAAAFLPLGIAYLVLGVLGAATFANPAAEAGTATKTDTRDASADFTQAEALRTPQWFLLTAILALVVMAGISLVSVAKTAATDIAGMSGAAAATLVGVLGLFNGGGRILWAWLSDKMGKMRAFTALLALLGLSLIALPHAGAAWMFVALAAVIYTCYGGGFGAMPSTAGQFFGVKHAGGIYGLMLIAWSIGGVVGPLVATALIGSDQNYTTAFTVIGGIALVGALVPFFTKKPRRPGMIA